MRDEARWFWRAAGILWIFGLAYLAWWYGQTHRPEVVGLVALGASGLTAAMIGGYVLLVARRIPPRPEDRPDAEVADGAGVVGFSPGSYWPVAVALGCTVAVLGLALVAVWLIVLDAVITLATAAGLVFESYTGTRQKLE
jgi:Cytochrome c oxidase subunit IV